MCPSGAIIDTIAKLHSPGNTSTRRG
ncbi:MAG: hypothetical protein AB7P33_09815 [Dehalococcoidia bacterium]